jgi:class 3 adenylate cyclase
MNASCCPVFIYDLWGESVNMASRMESHGRSGAIQIIERTWRSGITRPAPKWALTCSFTGSGGEIRTPDQALNRRPLCH